MRCPSCIILVPEVAGGVQAGMVLCKYDPRHEQLEVGEEVCQVLGSRTRPTSWSLFPQLPRTSHHSIMWRWPIKRIRLLSTIKTLGWPWWHAWVLLIVVMGCQGPTVSHGWPVVMAVQLRKRRSFVCYGGPDDPNIPDCKEIPGRSLAPVSNPGQEDALQAVAHTIPSRIRSVAQRVASTSHPGLLLVNTVAAPPNDPHSHPACPSSGSGRSATAYWRSTWGRDIPTHTEEKWERFSFKFLVAGWCQVVRGKRVKEKKKHR